VTVLERTSFLTASRERLICCIIVIICWRRS
jgi:hypothetical protein